jgi:hypothetical protein
VCGASGTARFPFSAASQLFREVKWRVGRASCFAPTRLSSRASVRGELIVEGSRRTIGPEPHPNFINVFSQAAVDHGDGAVAGAGEDAAEVTFPTCISVLSCPAKGMVSHVLIIVVAVIKRADAILLRQPRRSV